MTLLQRFSIRGTRAIPLLSLLVLVSCAGRTEIKTTAEDPTRIDLQTFWADPQDLESRDLFHGLGGAPLAPDPSGKYELIKVDQTGYSPGYDVKDASGTPWSVKLGPEAQPEVVASRVLWALGYHQPQVYLLPAFELVGSQQPVPPGPARFRREPPEQKVVAEWSWYQNPFVTTQPFRGLVVANLILNNWDWKTSNNKVYDVTDADGYGHRFYVVRDLGASLGKTTFPKFLRWTPLRGFGQGSRNDLADFEDQSFIKETDGERVRFDYRGIHQRLVDTITVQDVLWTCRLMERISDKQWDDAFRAAGYAEPDRARFVTKMKSKIREGLALS